MTTAVGYTATVMRAVDGVLAAQLAASTAFEVWNTARTAATWTAFVAARQRARDAEAY